MTPSDHGRPELERLELLLAQHVVDGLSPGEREELDALLGRRADDELFAWEQAAALCDLAVRPTPGDAGLSDALRARLEARGRELLRGGELSSDPVDDGGSAPTGGGGAATPPPMEAPRERSVHPPHPGDTAPVTPLRRTTNLGWLVAAAALLLAVLGWWPAPDAPPEPSLAEQLARLERDAPDLQRASWAALEDPRLAEIQGEVVWSDALQAGFMRLRGVPVNDPTREQYQLWIVDSDRDVEPVDGGVFDVSAAGEVLVPIDAKLAVRTPEVFAITLEQPGGVVVSEGPLLAAASIQG